MPTIRVIQPDDEDATHRALRWYERWRTRIHRWVKTHGDEHLAGIVIFVPDLLVLVVRLARDPRVPVALKAQLALAAAYILSPFDFVPEGVLGVLGLADDAGVLALVLYWLKGIGQVDLNVLRDNYPGSGDVEQVIETLHERLMANRDRILRANVWRAIERRFGKRGGKAKARRWARGWRAT